MGTLLETLSAHLPTFHSFFRRHVNTLVASTVAIGSVIGLDCIPIRSLSPAPRITLGGILEPNCCHHWNDPLYDRLVIAIDGDGGVTFNNDPYGQPDDQDLPKLRAWLKQMVEGFGEHAAVTIRISPQATHQRLIEVINAAQSAGVKRLNLS